MCTQRSRTPVVRAFARAAFLLLFVAGTSTEAPGQSQPQQGQTQQAQPAPLSEQDVEFARKAARGGMLQVALSKVATEQADRQPVQKFAQQTVDSMSQAGKQLHSIAQRLGLDLPQQPGEQAQQLQDALADLQGDLLEREYMWNMVAASTVAVNVFEEEVEDGTNPKLVNFADQMLPELQQHRQRAVQIWGNMDD